MVKEKAYNNFLAGKIVLAERAGVTVDRSQLDPGNFPHQNDAICWAAERGRALIAMSFGLGKSRIQCELARIIHQHTGKPFLIVCPLGVKHQFQTEDGPQLGMDWQYVRTDEEVRAATSPFLITNYERIREGGINPSALDLGGVSLDEGSVLRSLDSKTSDIFKREFADVAFRFVATATPSPNETSEINYYAEFLGIMDHGQALTRFFKRDPQQAGHLTLHPHHEKEYWLWVASWALFLFTPSDLGYDDTGYDLPPLQVHWHRVAVDQSRAFDQMDNRGQHKLLLDAAGGVREASAEKRATLPDRIAKLTQILADNPGRHWLLWHHLEDERKAIEKAVPAAVSVFGSQDLEVREARITAFAHGEIEILSTKPRIAGSGCNFQRHCYSNVFVGIDYKFQDFIQAIHRTRRFQQTHPVDVHIIFAESEDGVAQELRAKWESHDQLVAGMRAIIKKYGLSHESMRRDLKRSLGVERVENAGQRYTAVRNDCVAEVARLADNSVGLIHTSIPFGNHYSYTTSTEDFGHNLTDADFWAQMDFLLPDLLRVLKPGRIAAIHVKDRILYGHQTKSGFMEVEEFSDDCVKAFRKHGFMYEGRRTIVTDVVRENASTYRMGYTELTEGDSTKMGSGLPEYLLLFRKAPSDSTTSRADEPVTKDKADYSLSRWQIDASSLWRSNGNGPLTAEEFYDYEAHVARLEHLERAGNLPTSFCVEPAKSLTHWVWDDIVFMRTLNSNQSQSREQNHICPLPFDIVERTLRLYSNPGDLVLDPFMGLGTVPMKAIEMGRRGYGVELKPEYYDNALKYLRAAEDKATLPTLFDLLSVEAAVVAHA